MDTAQIASGERMTTTNVNTAIASSTVGAVGTYALLGKVPSTLTLDPGDTTAGSNLQFAGIGENGFDTNGNLVQVTGTPAGTWRCMGYFYAYANGNAGRISLFLRIS